METIFPDFLSVNQSNGGCDSNKNLKQITLERMLSECQNREATFITRPTTDILPDYQGENLLKAFPMQFPYGIGAFDANGDRHLGIEIS
jgi:hypothetical protein